MLWYTHLSRCILLHKIYVLEGQKNTADHIYIALELNTRINETTTMNAMPCAVLYSFKLSIRTNGAKQKAYTAAFFYGALRPRLLQAAFYDQPLLPFYLTRRLRPTKNKTWGRWGDCADGFFTYLTIYIDLDLSNYLHVQIHPVLDSVNDGQPFIIRRQ